MEMKEPWSGVYVHEIKGPEGTMDVVMQCRNVGVSRAAEFLIWRWQYKALPKGE